MVSGEENGTSIPKIVIITEEEFVEPTETEPVKTEAVETEAVETEAVLEMESFHEAENGVTDHNHENNNMEIIDFRVRKLRGYLFDLGPSRITFRKRWGILS